MFDQTKLPRLPEIPESVASMRERWPKALLGIVDVDAAASQQDLAYLPSKHRRHVYDSKGGIRLIASRDLIRGRVLLHVSVSCTKAAAKRLGTAEAFLAEARGLLEAISARTWPTPEMCRLTGGAVVHWWFDEAKEVGDADHP